MRILVTGTAGFIGFHLARLLLRSGHEIAGVDGLTPYYDVTLKRRREALLLQNPGFRTHELMLEDASALAAVADAFQPEAIIHLAAQAGVRYSLENPRSYVDANLVGTFNVMELARVHGVKHFMLASTSSVYGANTLMPFVENERTDFPLTLYAATKKATEVMSHSYAHLWGIPTTAFRFFTVYGPWGRPDMALFKFTSCMLRGEPIDVYNNGDMYRDFTYVDDLVKAVALLLDVAPTRNSADASDDSLGTSPAAPFRVVNIGKGSPVRLLDFIEEIERCVGRPAIRNYMPMQPGDVPHTYANVDLLERLTGYRPDTEVAAGVAAFVAWYKEYYGC
ncbi:NAD-dependent epimerase/dehydratase family protein [Roseixanthobacter liquoris]|uniref:NAD-dependent epimerase/dehydratase family protein n=1 Tax=Roseixanthobacter liquoris TaxID=3119921 RepID=UPI00372AE55B